MTYEIETIITKCLLSTMEMTLKERTLRCITGNILWDRIRNEVIRNTARFRHTG